MEIHVARGEEQLGVFDLYELRWKLSAGELLPSDLGRPDGETRWQPLATLAEVARPASSPPPVSVVPACEPPPYPHIHKRAGVSPFPPMGRPPPARVPTETCSLAIASLICGILSFVLAPVLAALPAIFCGHAARKEVRASSGRMSGDGMALTGLSLGYANLAVVLAVGIIFVVATPLLLRHLALSEQIAATGHAHALALGCRIYALRHNGEFPPTLEDLYPEYVNDRRTFQSTFADHAEPMGFLYVGGRMDDPGGKILLQSKAPTRDGMFIVGHVDGTVETTKIEAR